MREAGESSADELDLERDRARRIKPQAASQPVGRPSRRPFTASPKRLSRRSSTATRTCGTEGTAPPATTYAPHEGRYELSMRLLGRRRSLTVPGLSRARLLLNIPRACAH